MSHGPEKSTEEEPQIDSLKMLREDAEKRPEYFATEYLKKWLAGCSETQRKFIAKLVAVNKKPETIHASEPLTRALLYYIFSLQRRGTEALEIFDHVYNERFKETAKAKKPPCAFPEPAATFGLITAYRSDETSRASPPPEDKTEKVVQAMISMFAVADHYSIPLGTLLAANRNQLTERPQVLREKKMDGSYVINTNTLFTEMTALGAEVTEKEEEAAKAKTEAEKKITARPVNPALVLYYLIRKEHELAEDSDELHEAAAKDLSKYLVEMFAFNEKPIAPHVAHSGAKEKTIEFARRATLENARPTFNGTLGKIPFLKGLSSNPDHRAIEHCFNPPIEAEEEKKPAVIKTQDIVALSVYLRKQATDARTKGKISGIRVHDLHDVEHFVKTLEGIIAARLAGKIADIKEDEIPAQLPAVVRREFVRPLSVAKEKDLHDLEKELIAVKPLEHGHGHGDAPFFEKAGRATAVAAIIAQIGEMIKWAMDWFKSDGSPKKD